MKTLKEIEKDLLELCENTEIEDLNLNEISANVMAYMLLLLKPEMAVKWFGLLGRGQKCEVMYSLIDREVPHFQAVHEAINYLINEVKQNNFLSEFTSKEKFDFFTYLYKNADNSSASKLLDEMYKRDAKKADEILYNSFKFDEIVTLNNDSFEVLFNAVDIERFAIAMVGLDKDTIDKILSRLSCRKKEQVEEFCLKNRYESKLNIERARREICMKLHKLHEDKLLYLPKD